LPALILTPTAEGVDKANWADASGHVAWAEQILTSRFKTTADLLATSRNHAVLPLLLVGMKSGDPIVRSAVLRAAIRRRDAATHLQLIRHFSALDDVDQAILCDAHSSMPHHAAPTLKSAILEGAKTDCAAACEIIVKSGDFELLRTLLSAAENKHHRHPADLFAAISGLVDVLFQDLAQWASGIRPSGGHDPSFTRHQALNALEQSIGRYAQHQRREILDAFLVLAPVDNTTLLKILRDLRHPCHAATVQTLSTSQDSGIMERLVDLLRDTDAPNAVLEIIAGRNDLQFVNLLLHELRHPVPIRVLHNMKRLRQIAWTTSNCDLLLELDGRAQAVGVELVAASDVSREVVFELLARVMHGGLAEGRRASCHALAQFRSAPADELVRAALDDPDASVQATAVRQMRSRRLPDSLQRLIRLLDSPSSEVRDAARSSLAEFNFVRYRAMFDLLNDETAHATGVLVHKVDASANQKLLEDLSSPSLATRLRGIEMAIAMAAADDVEPQLIELTQHENAALRKEAILALAHCTRPECDSVLEAASHDRNGTIAEAARQSLAQRQRGQPPRANVRATPEWPR
jgi:HEAT repeat protein